jgi:four helix bundle suffix protein
MPDTGTCDRADPSDHEAYAAWLNHPDPAIVANTLICLIHQANYLLDQQIAGLERSFVNEGGYSEQLAAARVKRRSGFHPTDRPDRTDPTDTISLPPCPKCGKLMVLRTAKQGKNAGSQFLGCSGYPGCKGTLPV